jgi:archaellum component FlaC
MESQKSTVTLESLQGTVESLHGKLVSRIDELEVKIDAKIDAKIDEFAHIVSASFQNLEDRMANLGERMDYLEGGIKATHDITDAIFSELRLIREEIKSADTHTDVANLEDRVAVLERRATIVE